MCNKTEKLLTRTEAITKRNLKLKLLMHSGGHCVCRITAGGELTEAILVTQTR